MNKNLFFTLAAVFGVIAGGVFCLLTVINLDKRQGRGMEQVPVKVVSAGNYETPNTGEENEVSMLSLESGEFIPMDFDGVGFVIEYDKSFEGEEYEISMEEAVDIGLKYIKQNYDIPFDAVSVHVKNTYGEGLPNIGTMVWHEIIEINQNRRFEIRVGAQAGRVLTASSYYKENPSDTVWIDEDSSGGYIKYKAENLKLEAFQRINLEVGHNADVWLLEGDSYGIEMYYYGPDYKIEYTNKDGILTVRDELKNAEKSSFWNEEYNYVEITVPKGTLLTEVELQSVSGDIDLDRVHAEEINVFTVSGDCYLSDVVTRKGEIGSVSGTIDLENVQSSVMSVAATSGDIYLEGSLSGETALHSTSGYVDVSCWEAEENYSYNISSISGYIYVGDEEYEYKIGECLKRGNNKDNRMIITTTSGDIDVYFGQKGEEA